MRAQKDTRGLPGDALQMTLEVLDTALDELERRAGTNAPVVKDLRRCAARLRAQL